MENNIKYTIEYPIAEETTAKDKIEDVIINPIVGYDVEDTTAKDIEGIKNRINQTVNSSNLIKILEDDDMVVIDTTVQIKELKQDIWKLIRELCRMSDI